MNQNQSTLIARVAILSLLAFFIIGSYGIARPTIDSLYLKHYASTSLPMVWIASALFMTLALAIYNHFNQRHSLLKIFGVACVISGAILTLCLLAYREGYTHSLFFLCIWKEIYVVVLIEIFWSFSDVVFSIKNARWFYGVLLVFGSMGGLVGNYFVGNLAYQFGTVNVVWWILPILLGCWLISVLVGRTLGDSVPLKKPGHTSHFFDSLRVVRSSRYLVPLLFLIAVIQIATTLIDYEFNAVIQQNYPNDDDRTAVIGNLHALVDFIAIALQFLTAPILLILGVTRTLLSIPLLVGCTVVAFVVSPQLLTMLITKVTSKCFDYSIFRAAKEILYIPLSHPEKTQGKGLIDILIYRIARGTASVLILVLIYFNLSSMIMQVSLAFLCIWLVLTYVIVKRYRALVSVEQESMSETLCTDPKASNNN